LKTERKLFVAQIQTETLRKGILIDVFGFIQSQII
jgi:hypothetical protein